MKTIKHLFIPILLLTLFGLNAAGKNMPKVIIRKDSVLTTTWATGHLMFVDGDTMQFPIQIRRRGATSLRYDKPSLAIKLFSEIGGGKNKTSLFWECAKIIIGF